MDMKNEQLLDNAISETLGMNTAGESAAYERALAGDAGARATDRQLRETTAYLAAASPHMAPPADLRGRILLATAAKTYKLEDYRKASGEDNRFYKWGFYAAAAFLILGAMYNMDVRGKLDTANAQYSALQQKTQELALTSRQHDEALSAFLDPRSKQITWQDQDGKPFGRAVVNLSTHRALIVLPQEIVPPGAQPQFSMKGPDGKDVAFNTTLIMAPAVQLGLVIPAKAPDFAKNYDVQKLTPDDGSRIDVAGFDR